MNTNKPLVALGGMIMSFGIFSSISGWLQQQAFNAAINNFLAWLAALPLAWYLIVIGIAMILVGKIAKAALIVGFILIVVAVVLLIVPGIL